MTAPSEPRVLITADLHFRNRRAGDVAVKRLAEEVCRSEAEAFVIAGDIGASPSSIEACLELFEGFEGAKAAVPGNHDVWVGGSDADSWELHERLLPRLFERHGFHPLHLSPLKLDGLTLVGTMGWYDYSFRDEIGIDLESYRTKIFPGDPSPMWSDAIYAEFPMSDEQLTAVLVDRLGEQLRATATDEPVVVVTHHLATKRLLVHPRAMVPKRWRFLNAFLGSERFGAVIETSPAASLVVSGHAHRSWSHHSGRTRYVVVGSDYDRKQLLTVSSRAVLDRQMYRG